MKNKFAKHSERTKPRKISAQTFSKKKKRKENFLNFAYLTIIEKN